MGGVKERATIFAEGEGIGSGLNAWRLLLVFFRGTCRTLLYMYNARERETLPIDKVGVPLYNVFFGEYRRRIYVVM